jgi:arylsulfatase A-like enzyme
MWSAYLATVTFMDEQVGRILNTLKELGLDKETAVFFTTDHGYLLGEHHFWQKNNLREEVTRVPLIIKSPGNRPGKTRSIVELVDLFPTACELSSLKIPSSVQGKSLVPILHNPQEKVKNSALSFVKAGTSMRTGKWSYMKYKDGSEELYDMKKDPKQYDNLIFKPLFQDALKKIRTIFEMRKKLGP